MFADTKWIKTRNECLKLEGITNPDSLCNFVDEIYGMIKERGFSYIEAEKINTLLYNKIYQDRKILFQQPLKNIINNN